MFTQAGSSSPSPPHSHSVPTLTILPGQINTRSSSTSSDQLYLKLWSGGHICSEFSHSRPERRDMRFRRSWRFIETRHISSRKEKKPPPEEMGLPKYLAFSMFLSCLNYFILCQIDRQNSYLFIFFWQRHMLSLSPVNQSTVRRHLTNVMNSVGVNALQAIWVS